MPKWIFQKISGDQQGVKGVAPTDTKIIPFFQKLEEKSVDFRSLLNKGSKIRKARHKSSIRMRVNIDFL